MSGGEVADACGEGVWKLLSRAARLCGLSKLRTHRDGASKLQSTSEIIPTALPLERFTNKLSRAREGIVKRQLREEPRKNTHEVANK